VSDAAASSERKDPRVEAALREYLERVDRGEPFDPDEFVAQHPEIAAELRSFLAADQGLRNLAQAAEDAQGANRSTQSFTLSGQRTVVPRTGKRASDASGGGIPREFGRYRIVKVLGKGAMGMVYLAEDTQLQRKVALKTPHFEQQPTDELLERFYREARAAATLRHPSICPVFDVGQIGGTHYISMAYIEGHPLSAFINPSKPQAERHVLIVIRKLAQALSEAHEHGIVHRDLKPANIMIDKRSEPIIMDFGLARQLAREENIRITQSGMLIGTPAYMSPEQVDGEPDKVGPPSDQFSLGVILYELLTGQLPFRGSITAVLAQILTKDSTPPSRLRPDLDPRIDAACLKMLAKDPAERFASLSAVAEAMAEILRTPKSKPKAAEIGLTLNPDAAAGRPSRISQSNAGSGSVLKSPAKKTLTGKDLTSLEELARKCMARRDYDQVIQIVERVPEERRTDGLAAVLAKARDKADEIAWLICEIEESVRIKDGGTALKKADELLLLKPGHHRALRVQEEFSGYGAGGAARIGLRQFTQPWSEGGWIPWSVLGGGLAVFCAITAFIVVPYLNRTILAVQVADPQVTVSLKGQAGNVTGQDKKEFTVAAGDQELAVAYRGAEMATKSVRLKKGDRKTVTFSVKGNDVMMELDGETFTLQPKEKLGPAKPPLPQKDEKKPIQLARIESVKPPAAAPVVPSSAPAPSPSANPPAETVSPAAPSPPPVPPLVAPFDAAAAIRARRDWARVLERRDEFTNSLDMKLVLIPPGQFQMGAPDTSKSATAAERPQHTVRLTKPYYLAEYEVTRGDFAKFVKATGYKTEAELDKGKAGGLNSEGSLGPMQNLSWRAPGFPQKDSHPVVVISWNDAVAFCRWLSGKERQNYRLPTEAEWEYACRAGTTTPFSSGGKYDDLFKAGNAIDQSFLKHFPKVKRREKPPRDGYVFTAPVGSFIPNNFGLFDMHGNAAEWCQDWYAAYDAASATDPTGPKQGLEHVHRGGSFLWGLSDRSSTRSSGQAALRLVVLGFRIALDTARPVEATPSAAPVNETAAELSAVPLVAPFDKTQAENAQQAWAELLNSPVQLENGIGMKLTLVPPGEFQMGSEDKRLPDDTRPVHRVRLKRPFYMGTYEVTQDEYQRVTGNNPSRFKGDPKFPVEQVTPLDVQAFCRKLSASAEEKAAHRNYRVPTEAEWEYACRAGTTTLFSSGDVITSDQANFDGTEATLGLAPGKKVGQTVKVGSYPPNAFGLFDMHGNVAELVSDAYVRYGSAATVENPEGPTLDTIATTRGGGRLTVATTRGGAWINPATPSAFRFAVSYETVGPAIGFRVVCEISAPGESHLRKGQESKTRRQGSESRRQRKP
jgi:formylglycine-generating enzyme required for sulfatase activity/serine/threonine protein kinase